MKKAAFLLAGAAALVTVPLAAEAQVGPRPPVASETGVIVGGISPAFLDYLERANIRSQDLPGDTDIDVGMILPRGLVAFYQVPPEFGPTPLAFAVVNDRTLLVEPWSGRVIQILDD